MSTDMFYVPYQQTYFSMPKFTSFIEVPLPIFTLPDSVSLPSSNRRQGDKEISCSSQTGEEEYDVEGEISIHEPDVAA